MTKRISLKWFASLLIFFFVNGAACHIYGADFIAPTQGRTCELTVSNLGSVDMTSVDVSASVSVNPNGLVKIGKVTPGSVAISADNNEKFLLTFDIDRPNPASVTNDCAAKAQLKFVIGTSTQGLFYQSGCGIDSSCKEVKVDFTVETLDECHKCDNGNLRMKTQQEMGQCKKCDNGKIVPVVVCKPNETIDPATCKCVPCSNCPKPPSPGSGGNGPGATGTTTVAAAWDPNDKIGIAGSGESRFVAAKQAIPYTVHYENLSTATAPASTVRVTDQLDQNLDWRTFRLREIGFGKTTITVPGNRSFYHARINLGPEHGNMLLEVDAGIDVQTGQARWSLKTIDPATGQAPENPLLGFLPPNDADHNGEGFVSYVIKPKAGLATGSEIANKATIFFDTNEPIDTNSVMNTIDGLAPTSSVASLPTEFVDTIFTVQWSGQDDEGGSGLASYDVYISDNNSAYEVWLGNTTETSALFTGKPGHSYRFVSIAKDNAGNVEAMPSTPDAFTGIKPVQHTLTVSKEGTGTGMVTSAPAGISCGGDCSESFDEGSSVTLTAQPDGTSIFVGWGGDCTGTTNPTMVIVDKAKTCTASFTSCTYSLRPTSDFFGASGGQGSFAVSTETGCSWTAESGAPWITLTSNPLSGSGSGLVSYTVAENAGSTERSGAITIGGQTFTVTQSGGSCSYGVNPTFLGFGSTGGEGLIDVYTSPGCGWSAYSHDTWISVSSGHGSGSGTVSFSVGSHGGTTSRSGSISIEDQSVSVFQSALCSRLPVWLPLSSRSYSSLPVAYEMALPDEVIQTHALPFVGDLVLDLEKHVTIQGGFDCEFKMNPSMTTIDGSLTIQGGTVIIENVIVR